MHEHQRRIQRIVLVLAAAAWLTGPAAATIIDGNVTCCGAATFVKLTVPLANPFGPPNSVGNDTFQSPNLFGFDESQNTAVVGSALVLDEFSGANMLPVGTIVASHYIFFDPVNGHVVGTVNFDSDILGILTTTPHLAASDYLANTGVNYLNPAARGLEAGDSVTISGPRQILFDTFASSPGDYVRVLTEFSPTAAVPEPGAGLLVLGGAGLLWLLRVRIA